MKNNSKERLGFSLWFDESDLYTWANIDGGVIGNIKFGIAFVYWFVLYQPISWLFSKD